MISGLRVWAICLVTMVGGGFSGVPELGYVGAGGNILVSVATDGTQGIGSAGCPKISQNGRYVVFTSSAHLVPGDFAAEESVYLRDLVARRTELISVSNEGIPGNDLAGCSAISGDGRYVAFVSRATNLVSGDTNGNYDIFLRDRRLRHTELVSFGPDGIQLRGAEKPSISADGRYIGFLTGTGGSGEVLVRDRRTGSTIRPAAAAGSSLGAAEQPSVSADGRYVVFAALVREPAPGEARLKHIFVYEIASGQLTRVSIGAAGPADRDSFLPAISGNGRYVTFLSQSANLVPGHVGRSLDLYVRDRVAGITSLVSVAKDGASTNGGSWTSAMDYSGRYIVYGTFATNIISHDPNSSEDLVLYDQVSQRNQPAVAGFDGACPNAGSTGPSLDFAGHLVVYGSSATNLVPGTAPNGVYATRLQSGKPTSDSRSSSRKQHGGNIAVVIAKSRPARLRPGSVAPGSSTVATTGVSRCRPSSARVIPRG